MLSRWQSRMTCPHFLLQELQNYNSLLNNHPQENVGSHQTKDTPRPRQRRSTSKMVGGAESHSESNPLPSRDSCRAQTELCVHTGTQRPHRDRARPVFESPAEVWVRRGLPQGQGLWVQLPGSHSLWHKPSWRKSPLTPYRATE